jgi:hypothetical protein
MKTATPSNYSPAPWRYDSTTKHDTILDAKGKVIADLQVADFNIRHNAWLFAHAPEMLRILAEWTHAAQRMLPGREVVIEHEAARLVAAARAAGVLE